VKYGMNDEGAKKRKSKIKGGGGRGREKRRGQIRNPKTAKGRVGGRMGQKNEPYRKWKIVVMWHSRGGGNREK